MRGEFAFTLWDGRGGQLFAARDRFGIKPLFYAQHDGIMAHSVEGRLPFLDHHLVEKAVKMPAALKIRDMTEKYVLREAARPYLSERVYKRPKHPFLAPPATLAPGEKLFQLVQDTLRGPLLDDLPFFDRVQVIRLLDQVPELPQAESIAADAVLTEILSLCALQGHFRPSA